MNTEHKIPSPRVIYPEKAQLKRSNNVRQKIIAYTATAAAVVAVGISVGLYVSPNSVTVSLSPLDFLVDKVIIVERNLPETTVFLDDNTKTAATLPRSNTIDSSKTRHTTADTNNGLTKSPKLGNPKPGGIDNDRPVENPASEHKLGTLVAKDMKLNVNVDIKISGGINIDVTERGANVSYLDFEDQAEINSIRDVVVLMKDKERLTAFAERAVSRYKENFKDNTAWIPEALAVQKEEFATAFRRR